MPCGAYGGEKNGTVIDAWIRKMRLYRFTPQLPVLALVVVTLHRLTRPTLSHISNSMVRPKIVSNRKMLTTVSSLALA
jgi:hypothetical protein